MLFSKKADSRETIAIGLGSGTNRSIRKLRRIMVNNRLITIAAKNVGPIPADVKLWTDSSTDERVKNVPSNVRMKLTMTSTRLHPANALRFDVTIAECRKAVRVSHGKKLPFSTGSQAQ
jgi:hypothetical protein